MKKALITAALLALSAASASALELKSPSATHDLYTCAGRGLSRVSTQEPAPCCVGMLGCPQLLSNTGLIKLKHANRT